MIYSAWGCGEKEDTVALGATTARCGGSNPFIPIII